MLVCHYRGESPLSRQRICPRCARLRCYVTHAQAFRKSGAMVQLVQIQTVVANGTAPGPLLADLRNEDRGEAGAPARGRADELHCSQSLLKK